jgi:PAS domain S-box-containing protein
MNVNISTGTVFDRIALLCGAISMCIGGVGLTGWALGSRILTGVRLDYFPMAPNTALIVILLGCALISGIVWSGNRTIRIAIAGISSLCILIAGLTLIEIVTGIDLNIDHLLVNATGMMGTVPVGHMSPVTAICFLLGSAAFLLLLFKKNDLVSVLGTVIAFIAGVTIIGYWYGAPLLYGGTIIPVAFTTAVALGVLGVGLNAAAGPDSWPLFSVTGVSTRARILRELLPVILILVLIVNWINTVIVGHADSSVVLASAVMGILSLVVVYVVVSKTSRKIGDAIDQSERERKKAEEALAESRHRSIFSLEAADIGAWDLDLVTHTAWRSLRHDQIFGYEELLPEWTYEMFLDHVLFEDRSIVDTKFGQALENFSDWDFECRIRRKDGAIRWIWAKGRPEYNNLHEPKKMFGLVQDITERKQSEAALRVSEEWFRAIFNSASDAIHIHEIGPDFTPGKFIDVNDVACRMLKMSREEILSHSPLDIATEYHNPPLPVILELFTTKGNATFETGHRRSDGVIVPVEINSHIINLQGKTVMLGIIRDITERKRVEEALKKSQIQLAEAMTLANLVNWEFDVASGIFTFNDRFYALYGTTAEREGGYQMPVEVYAREFVHPDEVGVVSDEVQKGITATDPNYTTQTEHRIIRRDGEIRHIIVRFGITKDAYGRTVKTHGANQDITERKQIEEALLRSEERYRTLAEASPDQIFINGRDGTIQYVNSAALKLFRLSYDQVVGKSRKELFPPEIAKTQEASLKKVFETGEHIQSEEPIRFGKNELWINTNLVPLKDVAGNVTSVLGIARDITERKRTEIIIRESEYKFHTIFDATGDGMLLTDIETRRFVMANTAIQKLVGYTEVELLKLTISDLHPPADLPFVMEQFEKMVRGESDSLPEVPVQRKDGTIFYCDISSSVLVTLQERQYMLGIFHDITERKRAEDAILQANKQLNLLSSITRHDILNQLMALKGYLELSHEMIDDPKTLIEYIKKEEKAANTIEDQITFTKNYQALGVTAPEWQNVNASIKKAVTGLPMRAVRVEVDPKDPAIFADPLFEKVFYNLIDNALRYGGADMKTIRVSSDEIDSGLRIVCEDDGVGITAEDKKRLFTRGFGKNTGLGLFLSREILSITGITITETGEPGKGARFEITVPKGMWRMKGANQS